MSNNWAGYVASAPAASGSRFSSVSGVWQQPAASCTQGRESFSAVWVGLGGASEGAQALEQVGTDADCTRTGHAAYSTWFELLPAGPVSIPLEVRPGEQLAASVTVRGDDVTLRIRDLSTGQRLTTTRRASRIDTATAEWIVEAPSVCLTATRCRTLPLADFGSASFSSATATAGGHTGPIEDGGWTAAEFELRQGAEDIFAGRHGARAPLTASLVVATPSPASASAGSFSVSWHEQPLAVEEPSGPTLPGFSAGAPA